MRKSILACFIAASTMGLVIGAIAYAEGVWEPNEKAIAIRTTVPFKLELTNATGTGVFECEFLAAGTTAKAMEAFTFSPVTLNCGAKSVEIPTGSLWTADTVNTKQASLKIPAGGMVVKPSGGCTVKVEASVIGSGNDFVAGVLAKWEPGVAGTHVDIKEEPGKCYDTKEERKEGVFRLGTDMVATGGTEIKIK
jgi:hypothetical protein